MRSLADKWRGLVAVAIVCGILAACRRGKGHVPPPAQRSVVVLVDAPGLASEQVESQVVGPLELALAGVPGLRAVRAVATPGAAVLRCAFAGEELARAARPEIAARLAGVTLPGGASAGLAAPAGLAGGGLAYALRGDALSLLELRELQDWLVRPRLLAIPGVVDVRSCGGARAELVAQVDPARLAQFGVALEQVLESVERSNESSTGGIHVRGARETLITGVGSIRSLEDLERAVVATREGAMVRVGDVADVVRGPAPSDCEVVRAGGQAVAGFVEVGSADAASAVRARLTELGPALPRGVAIDVLWERAPLRLRSSTLPLPPAERSRAAAALARGLGDLDATVVTGELTGDTLPQELVIHVARGSSERDAIAAVEAAARAIPGVGSVHGVLPEVVLLVIGPDLDELERLAADVRSRLRADPAVDAADLVAAGGLPWIEVEVDRDRLARHGIAAAATSDVLAALTTGVLTGTVVEGSRRLDVRVRLAASLDDARAVPLVAAGGAIVPFGQVATFRASTTRTAIVHRDGQRAIEVWIRGRDAGALASAARRAAGAMEPPPGYLVVIE